MTVKRKYTEMTKGQFNTLLSGINNNSLLEKWVNGFEPKNKTDLVESRQIRALGCLIDTGRSLKELKTLKWSRLEFWIDGKDVSIKLYKDRII